MHPNPFAGTTTLGLSMPKTDWCRLEILNLRGQKARSFYISGNKQGEPNVVWDGCDDSGRNISSGIYLIRLQTEGQSKLAKAIRIR